MKKQKSAALVPFAASVDRSLAEAAPDLAAEADALAEASLSKSSRRALKFDWEVFSGWCAARGLQAMPASTDAAAGFLVDQSKTKALATLERYRATVGKIHKLKGFASPFADDRVKAVFAGIRRKKGAKQNRKAAMTVEMASATVDFDAETSSRVESLFRRIQDRAARLLGLATAFRGEELCSLDLDDLRFADEGLVVRLRRSKTDQLGEGRSVGVPRLPEDAADSCPARAVSDWLAVLGSFGKTEGPLFRRLLRGGKPGDRRMTRKTLSTVVKRAATSVGLNASDFGSHSLRAGYVTEARKAGLDWGAIMAQTGHKRVETVKRYDRGEVDPFKDSRVAEVFKSRKNK